MSGNCAHTCTCQELAAQPWRAKRGSLICRTGRVARICLGAGLYLAAGCSSPTELDPFTAAEVQTVMTTSCAKSRCHTPGRIGVAGDLDLRMFEAATVNVPSQAVPDLSRIEPGDRESSYLFRKIEGTHRDVGGTGGRMPLDGPPYLDGETIERIGRFIDTL